MNVLILPVRMMVNVLRSQNQNTGKQTGSSPTPQLQVTSVSANQDTQVLAT